MVCVVMKNRLLSVQRNFTSVRLLKVPDFVTFYVR